MALYGISALSAERKKNMENPLTWTDLHREIAGVVHADTSTLTDDEVARKVLAVFEDTKLDTESVKTLIAEHRESIKMGICGLSLPAKIFNAHTY